METGESNLYRLYTHTQTDREGNTFIGDDVSKRQREVVSLSFPHPPTSTILPPATQSIDDRLR